jgi:hypothetical protein
MSIMCRVKRRNSTLPYMDGIIRPPDAIAGLYDTLSIARGAKYALPRRRSIQVLELCCHWRLEHRMGRPDRRCRVGDQSHGEPKGALLYRDDITPIVMRFRGFFRHNED